MEFIQNIWEFKYALVPCLVAYLIFDLPILFRRLTRKVYVPIYFAFFPFGYSDELYAKYFDEDYYWTVGGPFPPEKRAGARLKILWVSVLSLTLTVAISPYVTAIFSHYFLTSEQFDQFFWTLATVKTVLLSCSLYNLRWQYRVTDVVSIPIIALIYVAYLVAILTILSRSRTWVEQQFETGGLSQVLTSTMDFLVFDVGFQIIFVSIFGFLLTWRITQSQPDAEEVFVEDE